jgi:hypothetical protein
MNTTKTNKTRLANMAEEADRGNRGLYREVNLWRCEPGDTLLLENGREIKYRGFTFTFDAPHHVGGLGEVLFFRSNGHLGSKKGNNLRIVAILTGRGRTR